VTSEFLALSATASPRCFAPWRVTVVKPVAVLPGWTPTSPVIVVAPVLVMVVPASTAKLLAVPRLTDAAAKAVPAKATAIRMARLIVVMCFMSSLLGRVAARRPAVNGLSVVAQVPEVFDDVANIRPMSHGQSHPA